MTGIRMSISTTSGRVARTTESASRPSDASPTISRSGCESMSMRMPARNSAWSSTSTTRIVFSALTSHLRSAAARAR